VTALDRAREELGVKVSVITGREALAFHPKLWLLRARTEMRVLSGSGNLTAGGLSANREPFEVLITDDPDQIDAQVDRYENLTAGALPLERVKGTIAWTAEMVRKYVPNRFRQGIGRAEENGDPVRLVFNMCRHKTEGFDVLLEANRPDLTVEAARRRRRQAVPRPLPRGDETAFRQTTQSVSFATLDLSDNRG
jgi:hypothetical protein